MIQIYRISLQGTLINRIPLTLLQCIISLYRISHPLQCSTIFSLVDRISLLGTDRLIIAFLDNTLTMLLW